MLNTIVLPILLASASYTDIRNRIIPDVICLLIVVCALPSISVCSFLGLMATLPLLFVAVLSDGIGGGDIKLTGALGFALGFADILTTMVTGLSLMLLSHAVLMRMNKRKNKIPCIAYPMAPFVGAGYCIMMIMKVV